MQYPVLGWNEYSAGQEGANPPVIWPVGRHHFLLAFSECPAGQTLGAIFVLHFCHT